MQIGLLLALQYDLRASSHLILFGHQSFREFLVGRFWADILRRLVRAKERDRAVLGRSLMGGRLLGHEDRGYDFLMEIVNSDAIQWPAYSPFHFTDEARERLVDWAEECFNDESVDYATVDKPSASIVDDRRAVLREAALAIGSRTRGSRGIKAQHPYTLRTLLAWFWATATEPFIIADGADLSRAELNNVTLSGGSLKRANLEFANMRQISLFRTDLSAANLHKSNLHRANFLASDLTSASLIGAFCVSAVFEACDLQNAVFDKAVFHFSGFPQTQLSNTSFRGSLVDQTTQWPPDFDPAAHGCHFLTSKANDDPASLTDSPPSSPSSPKSSS